MKIYEIGVWGNYSHSYNWDSGLTTGDFTGNTYPRTTEVKGVVYEEHRDYNGSRNGYIYVCASTKNQAMRFAKSWLSRYFPGYYED